MQRIRYVLIFVLLVSLVSPVAAAERNPMEMVYSASKSYESISDYTATMVKQERLRGILHREENILFKFKKPFQIYMKWLEGPGESREILYDPKKNEGKMIVNPQGLISLIIPVLYIDPDNTMVKNLSRHTITDAGIGMTIKNFTDQCELAKSQGDLNIEFKGEETISGRDFSRIEAVFPRDKSYYAGRIVIYIDKKHNLPGRVFIYDWKDNLIEKALYNKLEVNVGLGEIDFDPKNPEYRFKVQK